MPTAPRRRRSCNARLRARTGFSREGLASLLGPLPELLRGLAVRARAGTRRGRKAGASCVNPTRLLRRAVRLRACCARVRDRALLVCSAPLPRARLSVPVPPRLLLIPRFRLRNGQSRELPLQKVRGGIGRTRACRVLALTRRLARPPCSATAAETVIFEGMYISVGELKRSIVEKKGLSRDHAAELMLSEAETGRGSRRAARRAGDEQPSNPIVSLCVPRPRAVRSRARRCRVERRQRPHPEEHLHHRAPRARPKAQDAHRARARAAWVRFRRQLAALRAGI